MTKTIKTYSDFGPVTFTKNSRAKTISIRIQTGPLVYVTLPMRASVRDAEQFLYRKKSWIVQKMYELKQEVKIYRTGNEISFKQHSFEILPYSGSSVKYEVKDNVVSFFHPEGVEVDSSEIQEYIKNVIKEILRIEAKQYLPQRLAWLAHSHGFMFQNVRIRDSRTRWGSCTGLKNISLSLYLMQLPYHLIDYVLLHELCHTVVPHHGKEFYALMDKVTKGRNTEYQKEMRAYKPNL